MSKFVKRNTVVDLDICGHTYTVDMATDDTCIAFAKASTELLKVKQEAEREEEEEDTPEQTKIMVEEMKKVYENAINEILGDNTASDKIFAEDKSLSFHDDVFLFIQQEFERISNDKLAQYSPNRAQRRAK